MRWSGNLAVAVSVVVASGAADAATEEVRTRDGVRRAPLNVGGCPAWLQDNALGTLELECAEFSTPDPQYRAPPATDAEIAEAVVLRRYIGPRRPLRQRFIRANYSKTCSRCLQDAPRKVDVQRDVQVLLRSCTSSPAVLYVLLKNGRGGYFQNVAACAKATCPVSTVMTCAASVHASFAVYWQSLSVFVPWKSLALKSGGVTGIAPGAPPFGQFDCIGPATSFYSTPAALPPWPTPRKCGTLTFHPISFGIPQEDMVQCLPEKHVGIASLMPGNWDTYIFPMTSFGESEYKRMYREARFAVSPRKAGWESMRLYEILAGGCVPLIKGIDTISPGSLDFLDKALLRRAWDLLGIDNETLQLDAAVLDAKEYQQLAAELLRHTRQRLSTEAIARYTLATAGKSHAASVLYVANCGHGDYQCYLSLHGLRSLLGEGLVDFPKLPYMYRPRVKDMGVIDRRTPCPQGLCTVVSGGGVAIGYRGAPVPVYGGGFSYAFRLRDSLGINRSYASILQRIKAREFDAVVFGNPYVQGDPEDRPSMKLKAIWSAVSQHYEPQDILIIDGRDPPPPGKVFHEGVTSLADRAHYFLREIPDPC